MAKWDGRNFRLDGKAFFIAGAGGVGSAIARGVSEAEAKVFLADLDLAAAEKVARTLQKKKRPCRAYKMDIRPLEAGRNGSERVAGITEYRGKTFVASLINDTGPTKSIHFDISRKNLKTRKG